MNGWSFAGCTSVSLWTDNAAQNHPGIWTYPINAIDGPAQIGWQRGGGLLWIVTTCLPTVLLASTILIWNWRFCKPYCSCEFAVFDDNSCPQWDSSMNGWSFAGCTSVSLWTDNAAQNHPGIWTYPINAIDGPAQIGWQRGGGLLWIVTTCLPTVLLASTILIWNWRFCKPYDIVLRKCM